MNEKPLFRPFARNAEWKMEGMQRHVLNVESYYKKKLLMFKSISFSFGMQKTKLHHFLQTKKQSFLQWLLLLYYQCF